MKLRNGLFVFLLVLFLIIGSACAQGDVANISSPERPSMIISASAASGDIPKAGLQAESSLRSSALDAQNESETIIPGIEWQRLLGGAYGEGFFDIRQTSDGGYIGVGATGSYYMNNSPTGCRGYTDAWIVKFDSEGNIQWQKLIGDRGYDQGMSIRETSDGGYVFAGYTNSTGGIFSGLSHGDYDAWIVKLDSSGEQEWQQVVGGSGNDQAMCIQQTPDGGYIVTGSSDSGDIEDANENSGGTDILAIKLDSDGTIQWNQLLGGTGYDHGNSIVQAPDDSGYVLAGYTDSEWIGDSNQNYGYYDIVLAKVDNSGNPLWNHLYGGSGWESMSFGNSLQMTDDGGFIIVGQTTSNPYVTILDSLGNPRIGDVGFNHGSGDVWVVKLNESGFIKWESTYGGGGYDRGSSICPTDDGYIISGETKSSGSDDVGVNHGDWDIWAVKINSNGNLLWQEVLGGTLGEQSSNVIPSADGGFLLTGITHSGESGNIIDNNHGFEDAWLVKLRPRLIIDITDTDLRTYVSGAVVSLYDDANGGWQQTISSTGPVIFEDTGANHQFSFENGSTYNLTITADGYPDFSKPVTFQHDGQRESVEITAYERPLPLSYSMTLIEKEIFPIFIGDLYGNSDRSREVVKKRLEDQDGWSNLFYHKDEEVTESDFGTWYNNPNGYQGLDDATFHWHFGHGGLGDIYGIPSGISFVPLIGFPSPTSIVTSDDVYGSWDNKNKWVLFESCHVLCDKKWGGALMKSHGIFGYSTKKWTNIILPNSFFDNSLDYNRSLTQSYYIGTVEAQAGKIATAIFDNRDQFFNDHFPGHGVIAPDDDSISDVYCVYADWIADSDNPGTTAHRVQQGSVLPWERSGIVSSGYSVDSSTGSSSNTGSGFWNWNFGSELTNLISGSNGNAKAGTGEVLQGSIGQILAGSAIQATVGEIHYNITLPEAPEEIPVMKSTTNPGDIIQYWSDDLLTEQHNVTSEADAPQAALDILQDNGGLPQNSTLPDVNTVYLNEYNFETEEIVSQEALMTSVIYNRELNEMPVVGPGGFIHLSLGGDGENLGLLKVWRTATPEGAQKIITPERAVEKLSNGELIEFPQDSINITLTEMKLGYYERGLYEEQDYFEPVWIFTGNTTTSNELVDFYVYARHFANFTASETNISTYETVTFTDTSETTPLKWYWDFGDGTNSTEQNPSHMYMASGNYTVNLTAWNGFGNDTKTKTDYITVNFDKPLNADFNATPLIASTGEAIQFHDSSDSSPNKWLWDFGDGTNSTLKNPTHEYTSGGNYTVNLTSWNTLGSDTMSKTNYIRIYPDPKPSAKFSSNFSWENMMAPLTVAFTDQSTGNLTEWYWDFGDGTNSTEKNPIHVFTIAEEGEMHSDYIVNLTVKDIYGRTSTYLDYVEVMLDFNPDFVGEPRRGPAPLNVSFMDISPPLNRIYVHYWEFGDGTGEYWWEEHGGIPDRNTSHTYTECGNYTVKLTIDTAGIPTKGIDEKSNLKAANGIYTVTKEFYITVVNVTTLPITDFSANVTSGKNPLAVEFTDETTEYPTNWSWDFGDGTNSTEQNPVHVYNTTGTYTISLTATNDIGDNTSTKIDYITVLPRNSPVAGFSANITSGKAPLTVSFTDNSTNIPDNWTWNFGDGTNSTEQNPVHIYTAPGQYTVSLSVTNEDGSDTCIKTDYITVEPELPVPTVSPPPPDLPVSNFTTTPVSGKEPLMVTFNDTTTGYPYEWHWDFGDGTGSTDQNPVHTYSSAGLYTVTLNATNAYGSNITAKTDCISVLPLVIPVADFTASPVTGEAPLQVTFTDNSTGNPGYWNWSFGDGEYSNEQNPSHVYTSIGNYTVSLEVSNEDGSDNKTVEGFIIVTSQMNPPVADFTANSTCGKVPLEVTFTDLSTGSPAEWFWDFGDGTNSTEQNPVHVYTEAGRYTVSLTAINSGGSNTKTRTGYIKVYAAPVVNGTTDNCVIRLDWDVITDPELQGYKVVISKNNPNPKYPDDGYMFWITDRYHNFSVIDTSDYYHGGDFGGYLQPGEKYYFSITAVYNDAKIPGNTIELVYPECGTTTPTETCSPSPTCTPGDPYPVPEMTAVTEDSKIRLDWNVITDSRLQGYKVVISKDNPEPKYPDDGYMLWITDPNTCTALIDSTMHYNGGDFGGYLVSGQEYYFSITAVYNDAKVPGNVVRLAYPFNPLPTPNQDRPVIRIE